MSEYGHYVTHRTATDRTRRVDVEQELRLARRARRRGRRHAVAETLHALADRLDG